MERRQDRQNGGCRGKSFYREIVPTIRPFLPTRAKVKKELKISEIFFPEGIARLFSAMRQHALIRATASHVTGNAMMAIVEVTA